MRLAAETGGGYEVGPGGGGRLAMNPEELTIHGLLVILRRRRAAILSIALACLLAAILLCIFMTRQYSAATTIQVQKSSSDSLGLGNLNNEGPTAPTDAVEESITMETQANILQSDSLALSVIKKLNLEQNPDFKPHFNPIGWVMGLISPSGVKDPVNASLDNSPARRTRLIKTFAKHLKVKQVAGTRLINVAFTNSDPKVAAAVVNELTQSLLDYTYQTRNEATKRASNWLSVQLDDVRREAQEKQARVAALQRDTGVYSLGTTDAAGHDQTYSATLDRLQQATTALATATSNRILRGGILQAVKTGDPDLISGLAGSSSLNGATNTTNNAFNLLQSLRQQQAAMASQIATDRSRYGSANPKLLDDQATMASINNAISAEVKRIGERAQSDYVSSQTVENQLRAEFDRARADANNLNNKAIDYTIARQEATDSRDLYDTLFQKLKAAGVIEGLRTTNISVVDPGRVPSKPVKPNVPLYLAASIFGGVFLGACFALFQEATDERIQSLELVEDSLQAPIAAVLPLAPGGDGHGFASYLQNVPGARRLAHSGGGAEVPIAAIDGPNSAFVEAMRGLRTELQLFSGSNPPRTILVTSALEKEGKSTVSANLAAVLAQGTGRVLLVDADMRHPGVSRRFGFFGSGYRGLSTVLSENDSTAEVVQSTEIPRLSILPAGPTHASPSDLLGSVRMRQLLEEWKESYDYVVIDTPPMLAVTDATILSRLADVTLLIARHGVSTRRSLRRAHRSLADRADASVSVVVNGVSRTSPTYGEYHGYAGTKYYREA
ncbi:MAG TPA: polysaccharide biosynthesis tyrosine autokinase [Acidobacteriaceae bacterium]